MKKVIMGIGIPGSGKSTTLKKFADKNGYEYICPDDIRLEMTGDSSNQTKNREVWEEAHRIIKKNLNEGKTSVFDATFADSKQRKSFIDFTRTHGAEKVQGVYLDIDLEIAKERNSIRERKVPERVLEIMSKSLSNLPPEITDGFDLIVTLDEEQKLIDAEMMLEQKIIYKEFGKLS